MYSNCSNQQTLFYFGVYKIVLGTSVTLLKCRIKILIKNTQQNKHIKNNLPSIISSI